MLALVGLLVEFAPHKGAVQRAAEPARAVDIGTMPDAAHLKLKRVRSPSGQTTLKERLPKGGRPSRKEGDKTPIGLDIPTIKGLL